FTRSNSGTRRQPLKQISTCPAGQAANAPGETPRTRHRAASRKGAGITEGPGRFSGEVGAPSWQRMAADARPVRGDRRIRLRCQGEHAMRAIWIALVTCLVAGCVTREDYRPQPISEREAYAVITEVALQQPAAH